MPTDTERMDWQQVHARRIGVVMVRGKGLKFNVDHGEEWSDLRTAIDRGIERDREKEPC